MEDEKAIVLGQDAGAVVERARHTAEVLAALVRERGLSIEIRSRPYVRVEGWQALGAMLGVVAREEAVVRLEDGSYEAVVVLLRLADGAVIGRASARCGMDEPRWAEAPEYARRSMAVTRAAGKAYRLAFGWIVALAGYQPTPAEEVEDLSRWVDDAEAREKMFAWAREQGLSPAEVLAALGVRRLSDFEGSKEEAARRIRVAAGQKARQGKEVGNENEGI